MCLFPKAFGNFKCVNLEALPPDDFVAGLMQLAVMAPTERDSEFVAHLHAERAWLRKAQMMRIGWLTSADHTRL